MKLALIGVLFLFSNYTPITHASSSNDRVLLDFPQSAPSFSPVFTPFGGNVDEEKIPQYTLPPILKDNNGNDINSAQEWQQRRKEIIELYKKHVYGTFPDHPILLSYETARETISDDQSYIKKQVKITLGGSPSVTLHVLLFLPNNNQPRNIFLGLNFSGNQSTCNDDDIFINPGWANPAVTNTLATRGNRFTEDSRGVRKHRFPVKDIIQRGYGLATLYYGDIDPDYDDGFKNGVHALIPHEKYNNFSAISAWAWGLSRTLDYILSDESNHAKSVIAYGHSRLGKAALWAGALDERFSMVISNNSGAGGAALSRRMFGETVEMINFNFPHWFSQNFKNYNNNEEELPVDQHMLLSLIAPRPLYVSSAEEDLWADPKGEFLSLKHAAPVYELLKKESLLDKEWPGPKAAPPLIGLQSYHIRGGKHDLRLFDWIQFMEAADRYVK